MQIPGWRSHIGCIDAEALLIRIPSRMKVNSIKIFCLIHPLAFGTSISVTFLQLSPRCASLEDRLAPTFWMQTSLVVPGLPAVPEEDHIRVSAFLLGDTAIYPKPIVSSLHPSFTASILPVIVLLPTFRNESGFQPG